MLFVQVLLQEAHEEALQVALNVFNTEAVGGGNARKKYEQQLYSAVNKKFEVQLWWAKEKKKEKKDIFFSVFIFCKMFLPDYFYIYIEKKSF